jgi:hypothetical protein
MSLASTAGAGVAVLSGMGEGALVVVEVPAGFGVIVRPVVSMDVGVAERVVTAVVVAAAVGYNVGEGAGAGWQAARQAVIKTVVIRRRNWVCINGFRLNINYAYGGGAINLYWLVCLWSPGVSRAKL